METTSLFRNVWGSHCQLSTGSNARLPLAVSVLNIEPNDIHGDVVFIELLVDSLHVGLVIVVPAALVVGDREERWQLNLACDQSNANRRHKRC